MKRLLVVLIVFLITVTGCDQSTDPGADEDFEEQSFQVELINEEGNTIDVLSSERAGDVEISSAIALFGDQFKPPGMAERMDWPEEMIRRDQIVLHAEQEIDGEVFYISMSFTFQNQRRWDEGRFFAMERSKEAMLERFKNMWEFRRGMHGKGGSDYVTKTPQTSQRVVVNYAQFGFSGVGTPHIYQSLNGEIELDRVSRNNISGSFTVNLLGLPTELYDMEELPEVLDTLNLRVRGDFTANYGDYNDLRKLAADMESGVFIIL